MINNERICVIDIGSNSVRVLIADVDDGHISRLYSNLNTTRLYADISEDNYLNGDSMDRTVKAVREFVAMAYTHGVDDCFFVLQLRLFVLLRIRMNLLKKIKDATDLVIDIIDEKDRSTISLCRCWGMMGYAVSLISVVQVQR